MCKNGRSHRKEKKKKKRKFLDGGRTGTVEDGVILSLHCTEKEKELHTNSCTAHCLCLRPHSSPFRQEQTMSQLCLHLYNIENFCAGKTMPCAGKIVTDMLDVNLFYTTSLAL